MQPPQGKLFPVALRPSFITRSLPFSGDTILSEVSPFLKDDPLTLVETLVPVGSPAMTPIMFLTKAFLKWVGTHLWHILTCLIPPIGTAETLMVVLFFRPARTLLMNILIRVVAELCMAMIAHRFPLPILCIRMLGITPRKLVRLPRLFPNLLGWTIAMALGDSPDL